MPLTDTCAEAYFLALNLLCTVSAISNNMQIEPIAMFFDERCLVGSSSDRTLATGIARVLNPANPDADVSIRPEIIIK